jgi:predicted transcriptional regulator
MAESVGKALETALKDKKEERGIPKRRVVRTFSNRNRRSIFSALTMSPCIGAADISRLTGIGFNTVVWHLGKLKGAGYVIERGAGVRCVYLPEGLVPAQSIALFSLLNHQKGGLILSLAVERPGNSQGELAYMSGTTNHTVSKVMKALEALGVVSVVTEGNHVRYYPTKYLADMAEVFYSDSKRFSDYLVRKLADEEGENPKVLKKGVDRMMLELGPKGSRYVLEVGINPYVTIF